MRKLIVIAILSVATISFLSVSSSPNVTRKLSYADSLEQERNKYMNEVLESIKGKEGMNADSVFSNLQLFKGTKNFTARHFVQMMNYGWAKGLGVSCTYCHTPGKWEDEDKKTKQIGREMYGIRMMVNDKLKTIKNLQSVQPLINCVTCHRGQPIPQGD